MIEKINKLKEDYEVKRDMAYCDAADLKLKAELYNEFVRELKYIIEQQGAEND